MIKLIRIVLTFLLTGIMSVSNAQIPQAFNYQAIARNTNGSPIANQNIGVQVTILDSLQAPVYRETHQVMTNNTGLFSFPIGTGTITLGNFKTIDWLAGKKSVNIKTDLTGGSNYTDYGTSILQSVPYALVASEAVNVKMGLGGLTDADTSGKSPGEVLKWNGTKWIAANDQSDSKWTLNGTAIYYNNGNVGIGTNAPAAKLSVYGNESNKIPGAGISSALKLTNTNISDQGVLTELHFGIKESHPYAAISGAIGDATANTIGALLFNTRTLPNDAALTEKMRVDNFGNVGINTSNPQQKLDVNGNVRIAPLAGGGTRMVTTDNTGTISAQNIPVVPAKVFKVSGTAGDGVTDDTPAIQAVLNQAGLDPGCIVFLPDGQYRINGTLSVPAGVTLMGTYQGPGNRPGTMLLATGYAGTATGNGCVVLSFGTAAIQGIRISYPNQDANAASPTLYPYAIRGFHSARVEEVYLHNAYQGINFDEAHGNLIRNVWGNPLKTGINVDHCYDVSRIENVHFWPYFTLGKSLENWVQQNGVAFQFGRSDWQYGTNLFCYGYKTGFRFYPQPNPSPTDNLAGGSTNGQFSGCGVDKGSICVDVEGCFNIGVSFTNSLFASFGGGIAGRGVVLRNTNTGNVVFSNCNFWANPSSLAELNGGALTFNSCTIGDWGQSQAGSYCFVQTNGLLNVNNCTFNQGGNAGNLTGGNSRAIFSGNISAGTLTVANGISTRYMKSVNNPDIQ